MLNLLGMKSLEARRNIADLCTLHAIMNGRIDSMDLLTKLTFRIPSINSRTTRNCNIFRTVTVATNMSVNHPLRRMMESANLFAKNEKFDIFNSHSVAFKRTLNFLI